jgi:hypothetical protein
MQVRVVNPSSGPRPRRSHKKSQSGTLGGVFVVANKRKSNSSRRHYKRKGGGGGRARRGNPYGFGSHSARHHHQRRRHRRHNPGGFGGDLGSGVLYGILGGGFSLTVPSLVPTWNTGWTGVLLNGAAAWGGSMLVSKFLGPAKGRDFFVGGLIAAGMRAMNQLLGGTTFGLNGMGFYVQNSYPLPTTGSGPFLLNPGYEGSQPMASVAAGATPAAIAAAAAAPSGAVDEPSRWSKWAA